MIDSTKNGSEMQVKRGYTTKRRQFHLLQASCYLFHRDQLKVVELQDQLQVHLISLHFCYLARPVVKNSSNLSINSLTLLSPKHQSPEVFQVFCTFFSQHISTLVSLTPIHNLKVRRNIRWSCFIPVHALFLYWPWLWSWLFLFMARLVPHATPQ